MSVRQFLLLMYSFRYDDLRVGFLLKIKTDTETKIEIVTGVFKGKI